VAQAVVEVQEPKLEMIVTGPDDALYGETKRFELTLTNPGTGPAEDVVVRVLRLGGSDRIDDVHKVGMLQPGMSKKIDLEMVARQTGTVFVRAQATALGGLSSEAAKELFVRRPALRVDLTGPQEQFAGAVADYRIRVTNPGTATARPVVVAATLPRNAAYIDCTEGGRFDTDEGKVVWQLAGLAPKAERTIALRCVLEAPGKNRLEVFAQASADLTDSSVTTADVIGVPDLTLEVRDPTGPVLVGRDATYEIRIHNRGTERAERIDVVTFFSEGVEPTSAQGARYEIGPGQILFESINGLAAGQSLVLKITARAGVPGNLSCRTEVLCQSVDIKLAAEETTRFYSRRTAAAPRADGRRTKVPVAR
jgi:uncharacterized repeat protein (TIGR01451 family)